MCAQSTDAEADWQEIVPVLDASVGRLNRTDRDAVLLRFYQGKSIAEVGIAMGISTEAANKRVQRAVARLRGLMVRKDVAISASGLAVVMAAEVTHASPAALMPAVLAATVGTAKAGACGRDRRRCGEIHVVDAGKAPCGAADRGHCAGVTCQVVVHAVFGVFLTCQRRASTGVRRFV